MTDHAGPGDLRAPGRADLRTRLDDLERFIAAVDGAAVEGAAVEGAAVEGAASPVPDALLADARALAVRVEGRLRQDPHHTVVVLAGATGSGKSSLFNALTGLELSVVGSLRPTTSAAHSCVWDSEGASELLDWLAVPPRNRVVRESILDADEQADLRGLVLVDLPDHDSTNVAHRAEVERFLAIADATIWVLDPQKYADAAVHDRYLAARPGHAAVTSVVLNHADELSPDALALCLADVRRLVLADGLADVPVLATSAVTGEGLDALRDQIVERVAAKRSPALRLAADLDSFAAALVPLIGPAVHEDVDRAVVRRLVDRLVGESAFVSGIIRAVVADLAAGLPAPWPGRIEAAALSRLPDLLARARTVPDAPVNAGSTWPARAIPWSARRSRRAQVTREAQERERVAAAVRECVVGPVRRELGLYAAVRETSLALQP